MRRTIATMSAAALAGAATFAAFQVLPGGSAGGQVPDPTVTLPDDPSTTSSPTSTTVDDSTTTTDTSAPGETTTTTTGDTTTTTAPGGPTTTTTTAPGGPTTTTTPGTGGLPQRSYLPLEVAQQLATATMAECANQGFPVTVAIVDDAGVDILTARADGATGATVDVARGKAYAAAGFKTPTAVLAEAAKTNPALTAIPNFVLLAGGQPITAAGNAVGGIGVSGAPSGEIDDACATAGLSAVAANLA
jgi:uncharacterized protein GlcG (DUF336 family)